MLIDPRVFAGRAMLLEPTSPRPTGDVYTIDGNVGVVDIEGPLRQRSDWGYEGYDTVAQRFGAALADPSVDAVLLRLNSPGGQAAGCWI